MSRRISKKPCCLGFKLRWRKMLLNLIFLAVVLYVFKNVRRSTFHIDLTMYKESTYTSGRVAHNQVTSSLNCIIGITEYAFGNKQEDLMDGTVDTWLYLAENICDVVLFVKDESPMYKYAQEMPIRFVIIPKNTTKAPYIWSFLKNRQAYDWFIHVTLDAYLSTRSFPMLLSLLPTHTNAYIGLPKVAGAEYGCQDFGYIIGKDRLDQIIAYERKCKLVQNIESVDQTLCESIQDMHFCVAIPGFITHIPWVVSPKNETLFYPRDYEDLNQLNITRSFPLFPPSSAFMSFIVHPFGKANEMKHFHDQVRKSLRPSAHYDNICNAGDLQSCRVAVAAYHSSCVNNPSLQLTLNHHFRRECKSPQAEEEANLDIPTFILSLDTVKAQKNFEQTKELFNQVAGLTDIRRFLATDGLKMFPEVKKADQDSITTKTGSISRVLKPGELGYIDTMRRVFEYALENDFPRIIILDDDALPHKSFKSKWFKIMKENRCGGHLWTNTDGGILLLGSTIWVTGSYPEWGKKYYGGWKMLSSDMKNATRVFSKGTPTMCFNANTETFGSFAAVYHRSVYSAILQWIKDTNQQKPFDWVFSELGSLGYIVRGAFPNLVVPNLQHASTTDPSRGVNITVDFRARLHRWVYKRYCTNACLTN